MKEPTTTSRKMSGHDCRPRRRRRLKCPFLLSLAIHCSLPPSLLWNEMTIPAPHSHSHGPTFLSLSLSLPSSPWLFAFLLVDLDAPLHYDGNLHYFAMHLRQTVAGLLQARKTFPHNLATPCTTLKQFPSSRVLVRLENDVKGISFSNELRRMFPCDLTVLNVSRCTVLLPPNRREIIFVTCGTL